MSATPEDPARTTDGRHLRSQRSRAAIVDSMLQLLREGNTNPSSTEIADRAGVTQRTVFNHFADMESLIMEVAARNAERILPMVPEITADGTLDDRITYFCAGTSELLEASQHIRWAVLTHPAGQKFGGLAVKFMRDLMRERLVGIFAPELDAIGRADPSLRQTTIEILEIEIDPVTWRLRRLQNGLTVDESSAAMRHVLRAALSHVPE